MPPDFIIILNKTINLNKFYDFLIKISDFFEDSFFSHIDLHTTIMKCNVTCNKSDAINKQL